MSYEATTGIFTSKIEKYIVRPIFAVDLGTPIYPTFGNRIVPSLSCMISRDQSETDHANLLGRRFDLFT